MQEYILRLFAGGYNTLYDSATSWLEPTEDALYNALDDLEESKIIVQKEEFIELDFNLVPPVPKEESDSEEFEIEPEELKQLAGKTAADAITKVFEKILIEEKSKISGKLD